MGNPLVGIVLLTPSFKQLTVAFLTGERQRKIRVQGCEINRPPASIRVSGRGVSDTSHWVPAASLQALNEHSRSQEARAICENFILLGSGEIFTGHRVLGGGHREDLQGKSDSLILELGKSSSEKRRVAH